MVELSSIWLPILLSAVFVFIASSVLHMMIPIHSKDYSALPGEDEILATMGKHGITPGLYRFPFCTSMKEMGSPEHLAKMNQGPNGMLTILPDGPMAMGKYLLHWFAFSLLITLFVGYLSSMALEAEATFREVFRFAGTAATLGFAIPVLCDSIWKAVPWPVPFRFFFDGVVYSLVTGATFAWFWA